jgi:hypothetical protein
LEDGPQGEKREQALALGGWVESFNHRAAANLATPRCARLFRLACQRVDQKFGQVTVGAGEMSKSLALDLLQGHQVQIHFNAKPKWV